MVENNIKKYANIYRDTLLNDIMPFWMKYAIDSQGAINNCIDDDGVVLSRDRYIWSQGRALWVFSALYNRIEKRNEWKEAADGLFGYLSSYGRDEKGYWMYRLNYNGDIIDRDISIFVDGFVLNGLSEYFVATGNSKVKLMAENTYNNILYRLKNPGNYGVTPEIIPEGMKILGINMIFSFFFYNVGKILGREDICHEGYKFAYEILNEFYINSKDAILENVFIKGGFVNTPQGRICCPGHVLESMWFLISIFEDTRQKEIIDKCCRMIKRHIELGWDKIQKGIFYEIDIDSMVPTQNIRRGYKAWWVHCEALVATAYAYLHTGENWYLEQHQKIMEYAFKHFNHPAGEWIQWLDDKGNKVSSAALPVKDPFHLPRTLIYLIDIFENRIPAMYHEIE